MRLQNKNEGLITGIEYRHTRFKILYAFIIFILVTACLAAIIPIGWLFFAGFNVEFTVDGDDLYVLGMQAR